MGGSSGGDRGYTLGLDKDSKLKLTDEQKKAGYEIKTINGMEVKTFDLSKVDKIEFKQKTNLTSEEKLEKIIDWVEGHKKKSVKHDEILKLLTYGVGFCLVSCVMIVLVAITFNKLIEIFTLFAGFPVMVAALFVYNILRKIKAASKE